MPLATATSEPTFSEQLNPTAVRALEWARRWYPTAEEFAVTGISDAKTTVLARVDGDIRLVHYEDCDRGRCAICGRPLA